MRARFRQSTAVISLVLLLAAPVHTGWSCGPILVADEARIGLFRPEAAEGPSGLEPFYFTESFLNNYGPEPDQKDYQRNCAEWQQYTSAGIPAEAIYRIQYDADPDSFLYADRTGRWQGFEGNAFVRWLRAHGDALHYMNLAKRAEWTQFGTTDPWGEGRVPAADLVALAEEADRGYRQARDPFLKTRYAFQALRLWYYAGYHTGAPDSPRISRINALYREVLQGKPTVVAAWAALYYGMVQKDTLEQARAIVRAFDGSEEKKVFAFQQLSTARLQALLGAERTPDLRAAALAMQGLKTVGPALETLEGLGRMAPASHYLPVLVGREVAKVEDWLLSPEVLGFESSLRQQAFDRQREYSTGEPDTGYAYFAHLNRAKDRAYAARLRSLLQRLAAHSGPNRTYLLLATAHLYAVEGAYEKAYPILKRLPEPVSKPLRIQRTLDLAVAEMHLNDVRKPAVQARLLARIQALEALGLAPIRSVYDEESVGHDEAADDLSELLLLLSRQFLRRGDVVRAGLLYNKAGVRTNEYDGGGCWDCPDTVNQYSAIAFFDRNAAPADVEALLRLQAQKAPTPFDRYLAPEQWPKAGFYRDLQGTLLLRQGRYREALAVFEQLPDDFWETTYAYASYLPRTSIASVGTLLPGSPVRPVYAMAGKKLPVRTIVALQDSLRRTPAGPQQARLRLLWAHVQYNTSYWGKSWMLLYYGHSNYEQNGSPYRDRWANYSSEPALPYFDRYYQLRAAKAAYYEAFRQSGPDRETGAAALLMLACCDRTAHAIPDDRRLPFGIGHSWWPDNDAYISPYLKLLRARYRKTALYQLAAVQCPDVEGL